MTATAKLIEPQSAEDRFTAHAEAAFQDGSHIRVWLDDGVPDEDGQLRYVVAVIDPYGSDVHYSTDLWSGYDGQVDHLRALRVLLDIWLDLADEEGSSLPDWWTVEFDQWVLDHIGELDELHGALLADAR
jgi:hypothetical protein